MHWVNSAGSIEAATADLSKLLGVDRSDSIEAIDADLFSGKIIAPSEWPTIAEALGAGRKTDREQARALPAPGVIVRVRAHRDLPRYFLHQREQRTHAPRNPSSPTLSTTPR